MKTKNSPLLQALQSLGKRELLLLYAALSLAILGGGTYYWLLPLKEEIAQHRQEIKTLETQVATIDPQRYLQIADKAKKERIQYAQRLLQARETLLSLRQKAYRYRFLWFAEDQFLRFLEALLRRSTQLGLRIDRIERAPLPKPSQSSKTAKKTSALEEAKELLGIQKTAQKLHLPSPPHIAPQRIVQIQGAGNFPALVRLLYFVESFELLLSIDRVEISYDPQSKELDYTLRISQYGMVQ